jgi:hypothetical protein
MGRKIDHNDMDMGTTSAKFPNIVRFLHARPLPQLPKPRWRRPMSGSMGALVTRIGYSVAQSANRANVEGKRNPASQMARVMYYFFYQTPYW